MTDATRPLAKVLTVSDGVVHGTRDDLSGRALVDHLEHNGFDVVDHRVTADGADLVAAALVEREAPGLAEAMRLCNPLGRLSRGLAGIRGEAIIVNTPGSTKGCVEQLDAVIDVLPHALRLLHDADTSH